MCVKDVICVLCGGARIPRLVGLLAICTVGRRDHFDFAIDCGEEVGRISAGLRALRGSWFSQDELSSTMN